jgi:hypothetical protein
VVLFINKFPVASFQICWSHALKHLIQQGGKDSQNVGGLLAVALYSAGQQVRGTTSVLCTGTTGARPAWRATRIVNFVAWVGLPCHSTSCRVFVR